MHARLKRVVNNNTVQASTRLGGATGLGHGEARSRLLEGGLGRLHVGGEHSVAAALAARGLGTVGQKHGRAS